MIPRIFHRVFLDDPIPEEFERYWERLQELHPTGYEFVTWNDSSKLGWMRNREAFERATTHAGRSDVARYEILAHAGGCYLDTDVEPLRPFDDLFDGPPFAGWEDSRLICPTVMGSPPGHPAIEVLIEALPQWSRAYRGAPPNRQTGPYFLTRMWRGRSDVRLLPPVALYPVHWSEKHLLGGSYPPESYAVHHWAAQWLPNGPPQRRLGAVEAR